MEQSASEIGGMMNIDNVEDEIVVDALEPEQKDVKDKEFVLPGGQIIGLDQAVLQSIERCRMFMSNLFFLARVNGSLTKQYYFLTQPMTRPNEKCTAAF